MMTTKSFENDRSQVVGLPKEYRFWGNRILADKIGSAILLMPRGDEWSGFLDALNLFPDGFVGEGCGETAEQKRKEL